MAISNNPLSWWDRDTDEDTGRSLRADVRDAAHGLWRWVCTKAREILGDESNAAEVLEYSVKSVSRYLDKNEVPLHSTDPRGLVAVACYRALRRLAQRQRRFELVGGASELAELLRVPDCCDQAERRLFLEQLSLQLNLRSRGVLRLRIAGYDWKEIATMLGRSDAAVRRGFWRDVRAAHLQLLKAGNNFKSEDDGECRH